VAMRGRLRAALEFELNRSLKGRLKHLNEDDRAALLKMVEASVNRVLHGPTLRLRQAAQGRAADALSLEQLASAVGELFDLSSNAALTEDADMPAEEEPAAALESGPGQSEAADGTSPPAGKRRAHSEAP
jgi:Glutamyl-tRNAGlu reductase, dimerisation domain